jgi:nitrogen fixation NifU-like protein
MTHKIDVTLGASETIRKEAAMAKALYPGRLNRPPPSEILAVMSSLYSAAVLEHFQNPRNVGDLPGATAEVEVTNPVCGDVLRLAARLEGGRILEARFKTRGCVAAIACSSWLTEWMTGKSQGEIHALRPDLLVESLGGLAPASLHAADLACDALRALFVQIARSQPAR